MNLGKEKDFIGIKLGDVNNTWNPNIRSTPDSVHFSLPSVIVKKDSSFSIPISVKDFNIVGGFQFTLHWNPAILGLTGIDTTTGTLKVAYSDSSASKGMLSVLWTDPHAESTTLADNSTIFSAQFNAKGNYNAVSPLSIDASLIPVQIIDSTVTDLALSMISGQVTIDSDRTVGIVDIKGGELNGMEISPNPFADYTTLTVDLASARKVQLQVMDATGREVQSIHTNFITGKNQMKIGGKLAAGTYFLKFTTDNFSKTMKMIATGR